MGPLFSLLFATAWRAALVLLTIQIATVSGLRYLAGTWPAPPPILANLWADPWLVIHVVSGILALLLGPLQLFRGLRSRIPAVHRATGRLYVATCAVAAPSGLMLAFGTFAGPVAGLGFGLQAVLLALCTALGLRAAIARRFDVHREWMLRSYALIAGAITLRLMLPASAWLGFDFVAAYVWIAWLCWTVNLVLVEFHIRRTRRPAGRFAALAAA